MVYTIPEGQITAFQTYLQQKECAEGTVQKYLRDVRTCAQWLGERSISKEHTGAWREYLLAEGYAPVTINAMLAAVNAFLCFIGRADCKARFLKVQRRMFRDAGRELSQNEYIRLLETAQSLGRERLALLMETICGTGIRVSEVRYITVEAVNLGRAEIALKGKIRTILLSGKLCRKLKKYARKEGVVSGEIFRTSGGKSLSRHQIWAEMKRLCKRAGVEESKVFPHNLRHLFAQVFYKRCKDIARLADVLGHSSLETTRIYLITTGSEHRRMLDQLGFVL